MFLLSNMNELNNLTKLWAFKIERPKRAKRYDYILTGLLLLSPLENKEKDHHKRLRIRYGVSDIAKKKAKTILSQALNHFVTNNNLTDSK